MQYWQVNHAGSDQTGIRKRSSSSIKTVRGLPENTAYEDTGCDLAPSCLECPLALCKYDDPNGARYDRTVMRDTEIMRLFAEGFTVSTIALKVNTSSRTVYRVIQREFGATGVESGNRRKRKSRGRGRALRDRVSAERLDVWRQYPMLEMRGVGVG